MSARCPNTIGDAVCVDPECDHFAALRAPPTDAVLENLIALDIPKFIPGDNPHAVLSNCVIAD